MSGSNATTTQAAPLTPAAGRSVRLTVPRPYPLSDSIPGGGHFLLERTDDTTVPDVSADQTYSGGLGNDGEDLFLRGRYHQPH
jgi:hypothetical protein